MIWLRKGFVHLLSVLLLISLLGMAVSTGFRLNLGTPAKIEKTLSSSRVYDNLTASALEQAQKNSDNQGTSGSVSLNDPAVKTAAEQAFSPQLLENNVNTFLSSNYDWLNGKKAKPDFVIDFSKAKASFAQAIGQAAEAHLKTLPVCTPQQLAQLPIPADPLNVGCRPATLDPAAEGARVTKEVSDNNDFLSNANITADSLGQDQNSNQGQPYYQKLSFAPKAFKLAVNLPWILALLAILLILGIVFIAPTRRRGSRRVGVILLEAGLALIAVKFIADRLVVKAEDQLTRSSMAAQLQEPISSVLRHTESQLTNNNLAFGIAFLAVAVVIFSLLFRTRESRVPKPAKRIASPPKDSGLQEQSIDPGTIRLAPRHDSRPYSSAATSHPAQTQTAPAVPTPLGQNPPKPKRPRLIQ